MKRKSHGQFYAVKTPNGSIIFKTISQTVDHAKTAYAFDVAQWERCEAIGFSIVKITIQEHIE